MLNQLTISELAAKLAKREVSAREAMQSCLDQIARVDGKIHAFISHDAADALAQADAADKEIAQGGGAAQAARCSAFRSRSRTFSPSKTSRSIAARKSSANSFRPTTRRR
jgi:ABC-type taurine transport system ATPase subunit